ncbi:rho GTPase-activating protein [Serendipita sp. 401]|nr:rho GTPase-activating protein [Serendipita sp. 401]KAG9057933.1 rho GTPase-activating protein [Serendipita sp. 407]
MSEREDVTEATLRPPAALGYYSPSTPQDVQQTASLSLATPVPFPASNSPSPVARQGASNTVLSSFFAKGAKLFGKGNQGSKPSAVHQPLEPPSSSPPRTSTSRTRARNVSGPTNIRGAKPPSPGGVYSQPNHLGARSVADLGAGVRSISETPPVPVRNEAQDLRRVTQRAWAHSADDLGAMLNTVEDNGPGYSATKLKKQEPPIERARKPSLGLRIEAYRNNMINTQPGSSSIHRDIPSPATSRSGAHSASSSPMNPAFPSSLSHEKPQFVLPASDSSPVVGSTPMSANALHNRSNSYNVLGSPGHGPTPENVTSRHKSNASGNVPSFAFPFGGKGPVSNAKAAEGTVMDNRRASQVVLHSGFLNRNVGTAFPLNLNKNWKAFKAEIKGPKLYLYKPPSEKANGVRDLFATEYGAEVADEADQLPLSMQESDNPGAKSDSRRKRLFWGPGRHPEMTLDDSGVVIGGSQEALAYELVFGATFDDPNGEENWKDFSRTVLLTLPAVISEEKFSSDLAAVMDRYLRYAEGDKMLQFRRTRIEWLLSRYAGYYHFNGLPEGLENLCQSFSIMISCHRPPSPSFQFPPIRTQRSPQERAPAIRQGSYSSDINDHFQKGAHADLRYKGNMTRERMMAMDVNVVAQSLELFFLKEAIHSRSFVPAQPIITCFGQHVGPWPQFSDRVSRPHWLTHFIVVQIVSRSDGSLAVSSTHSRAIALSKWVRIAEHARIAGNECVWQAIIQALVSKPVARLSKVWRRVDPVDRQLIDTWIKGERMLKGSPEHQVPWLSATSEQLQSDVQRLKDENLLDVTTLKQIYETVRSVQSTLDHCTTEGFIIDHSDVIDVFKLWEVVATRDPSMMKPVDEYVSDSLQAEPVQSGRLAQYFYQPRGASYHLHALVPFTFADALPSLTFLDRSELVRNRKDSFDKHGNPAAHEYPIEHLTRLKFFPSEQMRSHWSRDGTELDDTTFRLFVGEMIVRVVKETQSQSRPASFFENGAVSLSRRPSRAPSIRVTPRAAATLERKSSAARRQSMPLLTNGRPRVTPGEAAPLTSPEVSVPVVIVGGTIERLVEVLVKGLDYIIAATSDDNGEMALIDRRAKNLRLDRDDYSKIWWSTYRSFLTPDTFLAMLRKMYRTTITVGAVASSSHDLSADANLRIAIFTVIGEWFMDGGGILDVLDQPDLYAEVDSWLRSDREHAIPQAALSSEVDLPIWREVEDARRNLISIFQRQTRRPSLRNNPAYDTGAYESSERSYGSKLPDIDALTPQQVVEQLDAIGAAAIRMLQIEDLLSCLEILEIQSKDKTGWIPMSDLPSLSQDEIVIHNIYFHLTFVEPSPLLSDLPSTPRLINLAQPSIRSILHCFDHCRKWATAVLAQPGIPFEARLLRMERFLQALELCRALSCKTDNVSDTAPVIRSFVETVLTTALLSPESRLYHRAWHQTAIKRRLVHQDSLDQYLRLPSNVELPFSPGFKLAVDFGWMIERLLEMMSMPDTLMNSTDTLGTVINFEKRRLLCTFVLNMPTLASLRPPKHRNSLNNVDMARLQNMHDWAANILFDNSGNFGISQLIKEEAHRENSWSPPGSGPKKYPRPFSRNVMMQQEKNKRDRQIRDRLQREKRMEQQKKDKQGAPYEKAMDSAKKSKQGKRASLNPFMRVVRPLSTAFPFGMSPTQDAGEGKKWTLEELNMIPVTKPATCIDLAGARVEERQSTVRPFIFTLETEDGVKYYFQATTRREMLQWVIQLSKTGKNTAAKRRTYIGPSTNANLPDLYRPPNLGKHPTAVFSVPLDFLLERDYGSIAPGAIPVFLDRCLDEVEARGFVEDGIYRIPGSKARIDRLKAQINAGATIDLSEEDIHNICSAIKLWIREIPDGLMPGECFWIAVEAVQTHDRTESIQAMRQAVAKLPLANYNVLRRIIEHLTVGSTHEDQTRMSEKQFSLVFGQTILTPPEKDGVKGITAGLNFGNRVVEVMLNHYHAIFEGDVDVDVEGEEEEEEEAPRTGIGERFLEGLEEAEEESP